MKRLLIRAGMSPLDSLDATDVLLRNTIGGNVGNLIYQYSVFKSLTTADTIIDPNNYKVSPKDAEAINEKYDALIIPLADAFREQFVTELQSYTKLIERLTIPAVVVGVGLRAPYGPRLSKGFSFDSDVISFVKAVLEKSSMLGLRGQITADYLTKLGFKAERDFTVIGCPSMYVNGSNMKPITRPILNSKSKISINTGQSMAKNVVDFLGRTTAKYKDYTFIPQWGGELRMLYTGSPYTPGINANSPAVNWSDMYSHPNTKFFLDAKSWIEYMKQMDFSLGARLHGNIVATLAGTPSITIDQDARMQELVDYHRLPHVAANQINSKTSLEKLLGEVDFSAADRVYKRNFEHYISFLETNGLDHIYKNGQASRSPLNKRMERVHYQKPVKPIIECSPAEMIERWERYYPVCDEDRIRKLNASRDKFAREKDRVGKLRQTNKRKDEIIIKQKKQIENLRLVTNRKVVRLAIKVAGAKNAFKHS